MNNKSYCLLAVLALLAGMHQAAAQNWTQTSAPNTNWSSIAVSSDGTKLAAVVIGGGIYTSSNSGNSWTQTSAPNTNNWSAITSSSDGTKLAAVVGGYHISGNISKPGGIYISADSGISWTQQFNAPISHWDSIASSADGTKLVAQSQNNGNENQAYLDGIYTSTNSGARWIQTTQNIGSSAGVASSADGTVLVDAQFAFLIYVSTNSGANWFSENSPGGAWTSASCSADGTKMVATGMNLNIYNYVGSIYISTNSGANWILSSAPTNVDWISVASSSDGSTLVAAVRDGGIWTSTNSGASWIQQAGVPNTNWASVASSSDGNKLFAAVIGGGIYTAQTAQVIIGNTNAVVLTNIFVTPINSFIGIGSNLQFTATGYYSDGSSQVLTNGGSSGSGIWTATAGIPTAKGAAGSAAANGHLFVVSGNLFFDNTVYDYNPAANTWTIKAVLPDNFAFPGVAGIGNKLYYFGGGEESDMQGRVSTELYIYDALTNGWSPGADMHWQRAEMGVGVINGKIYAAGGAGNSYISYADLQIYDPVSNTWTNGQPMPTACSAGGAGVINGKLYVVGGYSHTGVGISPTPLGTLYVYDPTSDSWTTKSPMPTPRASLGAAVVNGLLYAIDGAAVSGSTNLVEVYNPVTDSWSTGAPTLIAHTYLQPVAINGTIYIAGNGPNNTAITNAESYTPQNSLWSSSSPTVASIGTNGLTTGLTSGSSTITATSGSVSGNTVLTVLVKPAISIQPTNNTVSPNGNATLNVGAIGGGLTYQWQFNGTNISGANNASLIISNVSPANIGVYRVIVNNAAGSVTSTPVIVGTTAIQMFAGVIVNGPIGTNYVIQSTANLNNGWIARTNLALPSQPYIYIDYNSPTNPQQFYQAVPQ